MTTPSQRLVARNGCTLVRVLSLPDNPLGTKAEWAKDVANCRKPQPALVHILFVYGAFGREYAEALVKEYIHKKTVKKKDLIELFLIQKNYFLTLRFLSTLQFEKVKLFPLEELIDLEEKYFGGNLDYDFEDSCDSSEVSWFMRNNELVSLIPSKTLVRWRETVKNLDDELLIRVEIKRRIHSRQDKDILKERLSVKDLMWKLSNHIKNGTGIHSVKHYLSFVFSRSRRKGSLRQDVFEIIEALLLKSPINRPECEFGFKLAGWYIHNPQIPPEDRKWMDEQIKALVDGIIKRYNAYITFDRENFLSFER